MKKNILNELEWYSKQTINTTFQSIAQILVNLKPNEKIPGIAEISKSAFTTPSSVTRFCAQLGYEGYKELINRLFLEFEFQKDDIYSNTKNINWNNDFIFDNNFETILKKMRLINETAYKNIVRISQKILISKKIIILYSKQSETYAQYFYECLVKMQINVILISNKSQIDFNHKNVEGAFYVGMLFGDDIFWFEKLFREIENKNIGLITDEETYTGSDKEITIDSNDGELINFVNSRIYIYYVLNQIVRQIANRIK
ncbi:hypothetical protein SCHIN_v1c08060 [Spiroplasma chinense]|uniref:HTH rpiR-type domain-containing protein n=1 Tax=Spiroplasma chinense TaxID=216932 RepID=A0A5B9Y4N0_9MOLU|nr:hypothetical protein [Spiroplasma chinense]QEH62001.1 hypothetical protein SCHIN_v1c08060 [Spiroplasma chinense]